MESIDYYETWIFLSNRISLSCNEKRTLEEQAWSKLTDKDVADLKAAFVAGQALCCKGGKEFLEPFFGNRKLLAMLVNGWAYEHLGCREAGEDYRTYYLTSFKSMKEWTDW